MTARVPAFNLPQAAAIRTRLTDVVLLGDVGCTFAGDGFQNLVSRLLTGLPVGVDRRAVEASVRSVAGRPLSPEVVADLAWRLSANVNRLKANVPVPEWAQQPEDEWVPVHVEDASPEARWVKVEGKRRAKAGVRMTLRFLAGFPAGRIVTRFWSSAMVGHYRTELGFSKFDLRKYRYEVKSTDLNLPYQDPLEMGGLRFVVWVEKSLSDREPGFADATVRCTPTFLGHNREVLKRRHRNGFMCPRKVSTPCFRCPAGWDECPAACHPRTFITKSCELCSATTWHDPVFGCVACLAQPPQGRK